MTHHEHDQPLAGKRAAIAVGPLYEEIEALYPLHRLREAGCSVQVIGSEAGATLPGKRGDQIETEGAAGELSAEDLDLLVIAGGYGPDKLRLDDGLLRLVREMDGQGRTIAVTGGLGRQPGVLAQAGRPAGVHARDDRGGRARGRSRLREVLGLALAQPAGDFASL